MATWKLVGAGILAGLLYSLLYLPASVGESVAAFIGVNAAAFLPLGFVAWHFLRSRNAVPVTRTQLALIILLGMMFRFMLVPLFPVASDDIYRYVWDGKIALSGVNPFALAPVDPSLVSLHSNDLPAKINFPEMRTIYPPLAQLFFLLSNILFGDSLIGMKVLLTICEFCTLLLLLLLLNRLSMNPAAIILYAWSPVPIMYFGLDGHIDALGIPLMLSFIHFVITNHNIIAGLSLGLAGLAKLYPMFLVPFLLRPWKGWKTIGGTALSIAVFCIGLMAYAEPSGGLVESLKVFSAEFEFNGSVFSMLKFILQSNDAARIACGILFATWIVWLLFLDRDIVEKVFFGFLGYVIFSPVVHPWYLSWLAVLLVIRWSPAVFVLLLLSNLSNLVVYQYRVYGVWQDSPALLLLQYLPFYILLAWEFHRKRESVTQFSTIV